MMYISSPELTAYLDGGDQNEFTNLAQALLHEADGEKEMALKVW